VCNSRFGRYRYDRGTPWVRLRIAPGRRGDAERLKHTAALDIVMDATLRPRRPAYMPAVTEPLWTLFGPVAGHIVAVLGFGIMHPRVRALVPMTLTRRHDFEFTVLTRLLRLAHRRLPHRFTDTPDTVTN
jgi:uncharacterized protein (DUF2236 family)